MDNINKNWFIAALIRAVKTFAQTALAYITIGMRFKEIDWLDLLSIAGVAAIYSIITSFATGLPETKVDGQLLIDDSGEATKWLLKVDAPLEDVGKMKSVRLTVDPKADLQSKEE